METKAAWQSPESPCERQLERGFIALRFQDSLEKDFRLRHVASVAPLVRVSLVAGLLFLAVLAALDFLFYPPEFYRWSVGIRSLVMLPAFILALAFTLRADRPRVMALSGVMVGLALGLGSLALGELGARSGVPPLFAGYLVITFYVYFMLGFLFWQAMSMGLLLAAAFVAVGIAGEMPTSQMAYNALFLGFSNLIGIIGLYTLERTGRLNFLREGILKESVDNDALTGLKNRKALDEYLDTVWRQAKRNKQPLSLMMIDIDFFKTYNDLYGHQAGDKCLQNFANVFGPVARRPLDLVARYGGEEFVVILHGSTKKFARKAAERLRERVEQAQVPHRGSRVAGVVTISVGLAHLMPHATKRSKEGFLQLADEALYQAKERGRNQVVLAEGGEKGIQTGMFRREAGWQ